ncbi:hypothetical protein NPIL_664281 [Nephila pilipes]|uniref:Uncharacterized protein n=1 Tax=Nephila pilipes TaxID=299642 RepID=A0A8X6TH56_NEPPI|nr:hypothetical protein NPIL_664281 [Nephila pilipes]
MCKYREEFSSLHSSSSKGFSIWYGGTIESTMNNDICLGMLKEFAELQSDVIFPQNGAPSHWSQMSNNFWMKSFEIGGLEEVVKFDGHHKPRYLQALKACILIAFGHVTVKIL